MEGFARRAGAQPGVARPQAGLRRVSTGSTSESLTRAKRHAAHRAAGRLAEGEGFEPPVTFRPRRFSKPLHSTTLATLRRRAGRHYRRERGGLHEIGELQGSSACDRRPRRLSRSRVPLANGRLHGSTILVRRSQRLLAGPRSGATAPAARRASASIEGNPATATGCQRRYFGFFRISGTIVNLPPLRSAMPRSSGMSTLSRPNVIVWVFTRA